MIPVRLSIHDKGGQVQLYKAGKVPYNVCELDIRHPVRPYKLTCIHASSPLSASYRKRNQDLRPKTFAKFRKSRSRSVVQCKIFPFHTFNLHTSSIPPTQIFFGRYYRTIVCNSPPIPLVPQPAAHLSSIGLSVESIIYLSTFLHSRSYAVLIHSNSTGVSITIPNRYFTLSGGLPELLAPNCELPDRSIRSAAYTSASA